MSALSIKNVIIGEGSPKVIVPLVGKTEEALLPEAETVKSLAPDVVEWRVDCYEEVENLVSVVDMLSKLRSVFTDQLLLFTFRSHKEGGNKEVSDVYYLELNKTAILSEAIDLVDVELYMGESIINSLVTTAKEQGVYVIMSNHDFEKTPPKEEILNRLCRMQEYGADLPKIAVMPTSVSDVITLLDATNTMKTQYANTPIITMSMGGMGVLSRLAGEVFGSAMTFGAGKEISAPGQIPVDELRTVLGILNKSM
ncbi:type I 3-dehydroquinate dehydratase [Bacillus massiliigorillae]|uniref:type I 3-dehydroquinate dehydratase n=1 Tax=Bacillus massiliigorillae TaxID=1243664 RepID=UPI0003A64FC7|nr:type I 3-dehydroquinate dehydratase [Bacillus massiliigorillae]